jgi:hypothetical protein
MGHEKRAWSESWLISNKGLLQVPHAIVVVIFPLMPTQQLALSSASHKIPYSSDCETRRAVWYAFSSICIYGELSWEREQNLHECIILSLSLSQHNDTYEIEAVNREKESVGGSISPRAPIMYAAMRVNPFLRLVHFSLKLWVYSIA